MDISLITCSTGFHRVTEHPELGHTKSINFSSWSPQQSHPESGSAVQIFLELWQLWGSDIPWGAWAVPQHPLGKNLFPISNLNFPRHSSSHSLKCCHWSPAFLLLMVLMASKQNILCLSPCWIHTFPHPTHHPHWVGMARKWEGTAELNYCTNNENSSFFIFVGHHSKSNTLQPSL